MTFRCRPGPATSPAPLPSRSSDSTLEIGADIAPLASILLRSESVASSRIENLTASAKAIALAEAGDTTRENAAVIVANTTAMKAAIALSDHLDAGTILAMHDALMRPSHPEWAGLWRDEQVWIGGSDYSPHSAQFVPPAPRSHSGRYR